MRLIDADALINMLQKLFDKREKEKMFTGSRGSCVTWNDAIYHIKSAPTVDAVPVVRCKDCQYRDPEDHKCDSGQLERAGCVFPVDDDYFCAYGDCPNCGAKMNGGVNDAAD